MEYRLVGGWAGLTFTGAESACGPDRVARRWTIASGFLARSQTGPAAPAGLGTLTLGVERAAVGRLHAWVQVWGFPSRLLGPPPGGMTVLGRPWTWLGRLYAAVHAAASFRYLRDVARALGGDV
jgi:hypothetical protein